MNIIQNEEKLDETYLSEEEYLHRLQYAIGSIVQILERAEIDEPSRRDIYNEISKTTEGTSFERTLYFHRRYIKWCKNK